MLPALVDLVLDAWDRGGGHGIDYRATLALSILTPDDTPAEHGPMALYQRDAALLSFRCKFFGARFEGVVRCPECAMTFDLPLDLAALAQNIASPEPVRVEADGFAADVRPPDGTDIAALNGLPDGDFATALFRRCVERPTQKGEPIAVEALSASFRAAAATELTARGLESPSVDLVCGECGHGWHAPIDLARTVVGELDGWVERLLDDVNRLASAYHWSERDILSMPLRRRLYYLEAIG